MDLMTETETATADLPVILFEPIQDRVWLQLIANPNVSAGGVFLPDQAIDKAARAWVVASGPGIHANGVFTPNTCRRGDIVVFGKYSGHEIKLDGQLYVVMREGEILGRYPGEKQILSEG